MEPRIQAAVWGMSGSATRWYMQRIQSAVGTEATPPLYPTDFEAINALLPSPSEALETLLETQLATLPRSIRHLLVPNITIHHTLDGMDLHERFGLELLHPVAETVRALQAQGLDRAVFFGTRHTMQPGYLSQALEANGIEIVFPSTEHIQLVDQHRLRVYEGTSTPEQDQAFNALVRAYADKQPVVLACTELSMTFAGQHRNVFDMARLQVDAFVHTLHASA